MREEVQRWLKQADHDLEMAKKNYQIEGYDICLILCQQAIEKFLKALYIYQRNEFPPRIHSFKKLIELLALPQDLLGEIINIERYYSVLRYPDVSEAIPYENCTKEDAEIGIQKTNKVKVLIEKKCNE